MSEGKGVHSFSKWPQLKPVIENGKIGLLLRTGRIEGILEYFTQANILLFQIKLKLTV